MEFKILMIALVGCAFANETNAEELTTLDPNGKCPPSPPQVGVCLFNETIHCTGDEMCKIGQGEKCCPHFCNSICKQVPVPIVISRPSPATRTPPGMCPPPSDSFGTCVFDEKINCLDDSKCNKYEKCCNDGCNKICKPVYLYITDGANHLQLSFAFMFFSAIVTGGFHLV